LYNYLFKRVIDLILSVIVFILLLPVFIVLILVLWIALGEMPFFKQIRPGRNGIPFEVVKFRTMTDEKDPEGKLLTDDQRLTLTGRVVRLTSLDELPQLLNVIKGEMSLIGPRPLLMEYLPLYSAQQARRHDVRPGITGWAQVKGRNTLSWKEKFEYDVWYIDHLSFWIDLKILFITILKVLKAEGISGGGVLTAEKFNGKN